ncbi:hypothetical protein GOV13_03950 [Candidatus Pacearchaeota archaeon]|nr:hypothetical protein [Candidatus Pacearchaeota archaeon]
MMEIDALLSLGKGRLEDLREERPETPCRIFYIENSIGLVHVGIYEGIEGENIKMSNTKSVDHEIGRLAKNYQEWLIPTNSFVDYEIWPEKNVGR